MSFKTVKVSNVSLEASKKDIKEFFSFSGDVEYVEIQSGDEWSQIAFVTFKDTQGAETATLLSGATIVDQSVIVTLATDYQLPPDALAPPVTRDTKNIGGAESNIQKESAVQKAEDVVSNMLAKGFILGKGAIDSAKSFDEKHKLTSTATAQVVSFDKKIGLSEKISTGTSVVNSKVKEVDDKFQVSEKTRSTFAFAGKQVSNAGTSILKTKYISTGASWVTGAFSKVSKAASDVGTKTKEKVVANQENRGYEAEH